MEPLSNKQPWTAGVSPRAGVSTLWQPTEDLFRETFAHASVGMAVTDLAGRFLMVNPAFCIIAGHSRVELLATDFLTITHPEDRAGNRSLLQELLAGDIPCFDIEKRYLSKNGEVVWVLNSVSLRRNENGQATHCISLCQDITNRRQVEGERDLLLVREREARAEAEAALRALEESRAALRASEEQYRSLADLGPGVVWTARPDGWVDYANQFWTNYTGLTLEQSYGWGWGAVLHPDDVQRVAEDWKRALRAGTALDVEYRIKRAADGAYRWFLAWGKPVRDPEGRVVKWFGTCTDIDDRKQVEKELKRQHGLACLLHDVTVAAYQAATIEKAMQIGLDQVCAFTGWPVGHVYLLSGEKLIPTTIWHLDRPQDFENFRNVTEATPLAPGLGLPGRVLVEQKPLWIMDVTGDENFPRNKAVADLGVKGAFGFPVLSVGGVEAVLEFYSQEVSEPDEPLLRAILDIGIQLGHVFERKRADVALQEAKQAAETANRAKSEFLSRMSHELRTPLNAILGFAQLLEMGSPTPRQSRHLEQILKGGRHLLELINEVLDIARIEAGHEHLCPAPIRLRHLCAEVRDLIRPLAEQRGILLAAPVNDEPDVHVMADNQRLRQVLLNLVSNAVKYNCDQGKVSLTWQELPEGRVRLAVQDTGPGIPAGKTERLFSPFDRLGAESTPVEGTGLGLVLSKHLTEAMGGTLGVASRVGQGTTFFVELPKATDAPAQQAESRAPAPTAATSGSRGRTVIYIEDNLANLALVEGILAHRPRVRLLSATSGARGLELVQQCQPDLVLLDVHLPDMEGDEVLRQIHADPRLRGTPVVVISADATPHQVERARAAGAWEYLTKPINVARFLALVDEFLHEG